MHETRREGNVRSHACLRMPPPLPEPRLALPTSGEGGCGFEVTGVPAGVPGEHGRAPGCGWAGVRGNLRDEC